MLLAHKNISYLLLTTSVSIVFFAQLLNINLTYVVFLMMIGSLLISNILYFTNTNVAVFFVVLMAVLITPSNYFFSSIVAFFPLFLKPRIFKNETQPKPISIYLCLIVYLCALISLYFNRFDTPFSHNYLSIVVLAFILTDIYFGIRPSKFYLIFILISFIVFHNRSAIFLMIIFFQNRLLLGVFISVSLLATMSVYSTNILTPSVHNFLFGVDSFLYRSSVDTRDLYWSSFIDDFSFNYFDYPILNKNVPLASAEANDYHNSFITNIARDGLVGVFKSIVFALLVFILEIRLWLAVFFRASFDSFLFGGIFELLFFSVAQRLRFRK